MAHHSPFTYTFKYSTGTGTAGLHFATWVSKPLEEPLGVEHLWHVATVASF